MIQLAVKLNQLVESGTIFFKTDPENINFAKKDTKLKINLISNSSELTIEVDSSNFYEVVTLLKAAIFENKITVIAWNIKNFFTYVFSRTGASIDCDKPPFDLKIAESFIGLKQKCPQSFSEVKNRFKSVTTDSSWSKFRETYSKIYLPLIKEVIPSIESQGVCDLSNRKKVHSHYEIDGTKNGRLTCSLPYEGYFNPHSLSAEQRVNLVPGNTNNSFIYFDFHYMEVCMLAWLCQDEYLVQLVNGKKDFYKTLYEILSGKKCENNENREKAKKLFLPLVYGKGPDLLGKELNINVDIAVRLIQKIKSFFPKVFAWVEEYEHGETCVDYFGRRRFFENGKEYKYRNFIIQSPAALVCLEKLVNLYKDLNGGLVANIHDGYIVCADDKQLEITRSVAVQSLESESEICPGLKLGINYKISKTL